MAVDALLRASAPLCQKHPKTYNHAFGGTESLNVAVFDYEIFMPYQILALARCMAFSY